MAIQFPDIDPIAFSIGPVDIRWYALAYIAGFILGIKYCMYLARKFQGSVSEKLYDDSLTWIIFGVILGGRFGYVVFYNLSDYMHRPLDAFKIWEGGMSFHGGVLGVILALFLYCKKRKIPFFKFMDYIACAAPIGLFFGRIANFINQELWGRLTQSDLAWGVIFPAAGRPYEPRHPSQLYEAGLEGILLFTLLCYLVHKPSIRQKYGFLSGLFLIGYGASRFTVEYFREPDAHLGLIENLLSMGQILSLPMIALGLIIMIASSSMARKRA